MEAVSKAITEDQPVDDDIKRLVTMAAICHKLAGQLNIARNILMDGAENSDTAFLVADALAAAGWMAERAAELGGERMSICGDADGWMLGVDLQSVIQGLQAPIGTPN